MLSLLSGSDILVQHFVIVFLNVIFYLKNW